ncbi:MAG: CoA transferase [Ilumatobacteraceae bacterium]
MVRGPSSRRVLATFTAAHAAVGPVLGMEEIFADPHYAARHAIQDVGGTPMQGLVAKLSETPGALRWPGRGVDADGEGLRSTGWSHFERYRDAPPAP